MSLIPTQTTGLHCMRRSQHEGAPSLSGSIALASRASRVPPSSAPSCASGPSYYSASYRPNHAALVGGAPGDTGEHRAPEPHATTRLVRALADARPIYLDAKDEAAVAGAEWQPVIPARDWHAVVESQRRHAELYPEGVRLRIPFGASVELRAAMQLEAYHRIVSGPHAAELRALAKEVEGAGELGPRPRGSSSAGAISYAQCYRGRVVRTFGLDAEEEKGLRKRLHPAVLPKRSLNGLTGAVVEFDAKRCEWGVSVPGFTNGPPLPVRPEHLEWAGAAGELAEPAAGMPLATHRASPHLASRLSHHSSSPEGRLKQTRFAVAESPASGPM